jgi:hypothetical protein
VTRRPARRFMGSAVILAIGNVDGAEITRHLGVKAKTV